MIFPFMSLQLELAVNERLTYAQLINRRALPVASLRIINQGTSPEWLRLIPSVGGTPLAKKRVNKILPGEIYEMNVSAWALPADLPYPETGDRVVVFRMTLEGRDGETDELSFNIRLMPRNMLCVHVREADLIAAHVTPDCEPLRALTGEAVKKSGTDARQMLREIYETVRARKLAYQPVGLIADPGYQAAFSALHTLEHGGSCTDMSLMFAALMRTAGLHPVLFLFNDHMIAGCWLADRHFPSAVCIDPAGVLALIESGVLLSIECTAACEQPGKDFDAACADALALLRSPDRHSIALDVWQALASGIQGIPLPEDIPAQPIEAPGARIHACPHCGNTHFTPEELAQPTVVCPACGIAFTPAGLPEPVPQTSNAEPPMEEPTPEPAKPLLPPKPMEISATEMLCGLRGATAIVTGGSKKADRLAARAQFQGRPVTAVAPDALSGAAMTEMILADTIKMIGDRAFRRCTSLRAAILPAALEKLGLSALAGCTALERATIPGTLRCIPRMAFSGCTALKEITIAEGVEIIDAYAFSGCTALENITIPASVRTIAARAFANCTSLREVRLLSDSTRVDAAAFSGCKFL